MLAYEIEMLKAVPVDEIAVVVGYKDSVVKKHLENYRVTIAANRHFSETEMLDSVLLGVEKLGIKPDRLLVLPADTPLVSEKTCSTLMEADCTIAAIPRYNGLSGHPIMFTAKALRLLADYDGSNGMRGFVANNADGIAYIDVPDPAICMRARGDKFIEQLTAYEIERRTDGRLHAEIEANLALGVTVMNAELSRVLNLVESTGSLQMASDCVGISYSKSWKSIKNLELALGVSIIESTVGGKSGGNSQLTAAGKYFLRQYDEMLKDAEKLGKWLFSQYFLTKLCKRYKNSADFSTLFTCLNCALFLKI